MLERRRFLGMATFGVATCAAPDWVLRAFAQDADAPLESADALTLARKRAKGSGKPLLVFVIPEDQGQTYDRGDLVGALFEYGGDALIADLALCEVACLPLAALGGYVEPRKDGEAPPLALLFDDFAAKDAARSFAGVHPERPQQDWEVSHEDAARAYEKWIAPLAEDLREFLAPDVETLRRYARSLRSVVGEVKARSVEAWLKSGEAPERASLDALAAWVALHARSSEDAAKLWIPRLAKSARKRLWEAPLEGARWARTEGCGIEFETGPQDWMVECGMGHVPEGSRRFLWFFTE